MIIEYGVNLSPVAQPRAKARVIRMGDAGHRVQMYTPSGERVGAYKTGIAESFKEMAPFEKGRLEELMELPVTLEVEFQIKRPKDMCGTRFSGEKIPHTKKPDADNLLKAVMDALNKVAWNDDSQVICAKSSKFYAPVVLGGKTGKARNSDTPMVTVRIKYHEN
tara:strand:+ start:2447 stop:2938 length:492 start_codon:yes stop_codon:yes gene_type:complete